MNKPSILLISADELRQDCLSCYGGRVIQTPNLDALAVEGTGLPTRIAQARDACPPGAAF